MAGYGSDEEFQAWLASQGFALPPGSPCAGTLRQIGSDYVDAAYGHLLMCSQKTGGWNQEREWPRRGHRIRGELVPDDLIPQAWINASYRAAYLQATIPGWATNQVTPGRVTKREKVDVIEREFFEADQAGGGASTAPGFPSDAVINGLVLPWLCSSVRSANSLFRVI
ncbi:MAG TPA: DnaT-like ssDNA-binding protein [Porticoccaceae bacterium]